MIQRKQGSKDALKLVFQAEAPNACHITRTQDQTPYPPLYRTTAAVCWHRSICLGETTCYECPIPTARSEANGRPRKTFPPRSSSLLFLRTKLAKGLLQSVGSNIVHSNQGNQAPRPFHRGYTAWILLAVLLVYPDCDSYRRINNVYHSNFILILV